MSHLSTREMPNRWFLFRLEHVHSPNGQFTGQLHTPLYWRVELQHVLGGKLTVAKADTPQGAFDACVKDIHHKAEMEYWTDSATIQEELKYKPYV